MRWIARNGLYLYTMFSRHHHSYTPKMFYLFISITFCRLKSKVLLWYLSYFSRQNNSRVGIAVTSSVHKATPLHHHQIVYTGRHLAASFASCEEWLRITEELLHHAPTMHFFHTFFFLVGNGQFWSSIHKI